MTEYKLVPLEPIRRALVALERFAYDTVGGRNAARELRELLAAPPIPAQQTVDDWQPIETAPKPDMGANGFGKRLLLVADCGEGTIPSVRRGYWEGTDWYLDCCIGLATSCGYRVTHWRPLPAPPAIDHWPEQPVEQKPEVLAKGYFHPLPDENDYEFYDAEENFPNDSDCPDCVPAVIVRNSAVANRPSPEVAALVEALECMIIGACAVAVPHNGERAVLQDAVSIARKALAAYRKQGGGS